MKKMLPFKKILFFLVASMSFPGFTQTVIENYPVDAASVVHPGVPKGEILKFNYVESKIYPGTSREYWRKCKSPPL